MLGKIARINEEKKRSNAPYFKASGKCNEKNCECSYTFSIQSKQETNGLGFVQIEVSRINFHNHSKKGSNQIRGDERISLAEQCILSSNGSANAFVNGIISHNILAGEDVPQDLDVKSTRFKDVVRKCVSEYMNQDMVRNYNSIF